MNEPRNEADIGIPGGAAGDVVPRRLVRAPESCAVSEFHDLRRGSRYAEELGGSSV